MEPGEIAAGVGFGICLPLFVAGATIGGMAFNDYPEKKYLGEMDIQKAVQYEAAAESLREIVDQMDYNMLVDNDEAIIISMPDNDSLELSLKGTIREIDSIEELNRYAKPLIQAYTDLEALDNEYPFPTQIDDIKTKAEYGERYYDIRSDLDALVTDMLDYKEELAPNIEEAYKKVKSFNTASGITSGLGYSIGLIGSAISGYIFINAVVYELQYWKPRRKNRP